MTPVPAPKHACSLCARRKVKCDKRDPCSNCLKAQAQCSYEAPIPSRPRKRAADEDLLARLALYEDLMRKHSVDFTHCANTWVSEGLEGKLLKDSDSQSPAPITSFPKENTAPRVERCLWSTLDSELKYPPIQHLWHKEDALLNPLPPLQTAPADPQPDLDKLHPEPRSIYRLWHAFVESVNPLTKIIHVPSLQPRILDASWDPSAASKSLKAMLFAIYTQAVSSMPADDCMASFDETRDVLFIRYRAATFRALVDAEFLTTRDFEVLQAFVLFLLADPESDLTSTLTGAAIRLGQKMGLHRENADPEMSFFDKEMRVRLWCQLCGLDSRSRAVITPGMNPPPSELGDIRLPMNINDADLHPDMDGAPVEHNNPTEMMCVLTKFAVTGWLRTSPTAAIIFENIFQGPARGKLSFEREDEAVNELEAMYNEKLFHNWDKRIPLHEFTHAMASLAIARMRFKIHHPRGRATATGGDVLMTRRESDMLFESAVVSLEMVEVAMRSKFSSHLFTHMHMTSKFQVDAYIYVISDLRWRCSGDRVALAWKLVEDLYDKHPELINDTENPFFTSLGNLTLEAWEARRKVLVLGQGAREADVTPHFIQSLWNKRQSRNEASIQALAGSEPNALDGLRLMSDIDFDLDCWNDFLQL
ncbi:hypothetical protein AK830_g3739 [Neonectria ditissima]|uniref:Zn(2)-C6 fungal-type domain-containing protein n=1 Tax=Neonectria ditissima TaxID=78410 RepID=A0A0P7BPK0_9HYPO|nr:hypothetical protein AK830_g3739 [Neonectria ditissima]